MLKHHAVRAEGTTRWILDELIDDPCALCGGESVPNPCLACSPDYGTNHHHGRVHNTTASSTRCAGNAGNFTPGRNSPSIP